MTGRGAWSSVGHDNGSRWYEYLAGKPLDGLGPERGPDYLAVNYGVKGLQSRLNVLLSSSQPLVVDGVFGSLTSKAASEAQKVLGVTVDGQVGPGTCKALWLPLIEGGERLHQIPGRYLCGLVRLESSYDPGAVGYLTPTDHGLVQINSDANPNLTLEQVFNPVFALDYAGKRLHTAFDKFNRWDCAIASYNSPRSAAAWASTGSPPNPTIAKYVATIMGGCP